LWTKQGPSPLTAWPLARWRVLREFLCARLALHLSKNPCSVTVSSNLGRLPFPLAALVSLNASSSFYSIVSTSSRCFFQLPIFFCHPRFREDCRTIRPAGIRGQPTLSIFIATSGLHPNRHRWQRPQPLPSSLAWRARSGLAVLVSAKDQFLQNLAVFVNTFFRFPRFFFEAGSPPQDDSSTRARSPSRLPPHYRAARGSVHCRFSESLSRHAVGFRVERRDCLHPPAAAVNPFLRLSSFFLPAALAAKWKAPGSFLVGRSAYPRKRRRSQATFSFFFALNFNWLRIPFRG